MLLSKTLHVATLATLLGATALVGWAQQTEPDTNSKSGAPVVTAQPNVRTSPTTAPRPKATPLPKATAEAKPTPRPAPVRTVTPALPKPTATPVQPTPTPVPPTPTPKPTPLPTWKPAPTPKVNVEDLTIPGDVPPPPPPGALAPPAGAKPLPPGAQPPPGTVPPGGLINAATLPAANAVTVPPPPPTPNLQREIDLPAPSSELTTVEQVENRVVGKIPWWDFVSLFRLEFMHDALLAGLAAAIVCAYLGLFVVLRRIVFVGVALAEMSSAGIALGLLPGLAAVGISPIIGAGLSMLLGVVLFSIRWSPRRVPHESYIGIMYGVATAVGILLMAKSPQGEGHMFTLLQGEVLAVNWLQTKELAYASIAVLVVHLLFSRQFVLISFDRESASTQGFRTAAWDFLLFLTIGIVISFAIRSVGVLLTTSMLILPAATALLATNRLRAASLLAPLFGALPVVLGLMFSYSADLPPSATIVAVSFVLMLPALIVHLVRRS